MTEVAYEMGYGRNFLPPGQSDEGDQCDSIVQRGYRMFLVPEASPFGMTHQWSFLKAIATINLVSGTANYDLPDNWGAPIGEPFITSGNYNTPFRIQNVEISHLDYHRMNFPNGSPAQPRMLSIFPKPFVPATGQRWQVGFYPTPGAGYALHWRYHVIPNRLSQTAPYHAGGMKHSQTVLAACLAVCESVKHETQGEKREEFVRRLIASIATDKNESSVDFVGHMADWLRSYGRSSRGESLTLNFGAP